MKMTELTFTESLGGGVLGAGIPLIALSLFSDFIRAVFNRPDKNEPENLSGPAQEEMVIKEETEEGEEELVAVITAALSAYLQKPADRIKIGLIRRIHQTTPIWGMESRLNPME
ncbi:OadG family protein [Thermosediminibacter oceani]|nr:OadG family protein [Thermosediminibacter oceani]